MSPSVPVVSLCRVGGKGGACCWACACTCLWGVACAFHGLWMVAWASARPALDVGLVGCLWWLGGGVLRWSVVACVPRQLMASKKCL